MKLNKLFLTALMLMTITFSSVSFAGLLVPNPKAGPQAPVEESTTLNSVALDTTYEITENETLNASFEAVIASGEQVSYIVTGNPSKGTVTQSGDINFIYKPNQNYFGTDSFSFRLKSGDVYSNTATITINIEQDPEEIIPFYYTDMQNHWANYSASHLAARGLIVGEEIGNKFYFHPSRTMTRGEFMLFLLSMTETDWENRQSTLKISIVDAAKYDSYMLNAAKYAIEIGLLKGSTAFNGIYLNLNDQITRAEAFTMISNALADKSSQGTISYRDVSSIPTWALSAIRNLTAYKIIQGSSDGRLNPQSILTRGEAAELCYKLVKQLEQNNT